MSIPPKKKMSLKIYPKSQQAEGAFDNGRIRENKPIGFPGEGGKLKPYSNLFYWAHAWSEEGGLIDLHPHKVFEIMSFVLKGSIEHYDTKIKQWRKLHEGDMQIIRAGSGVSHAEKINPHSAIFQIWLDPDVQKTINMPASYDDHASDVFPVVNEFGMRTKVYAGDNTPLKMETPGISIKEHSFGAGEQMLMLNNESIYSIYLMEGEIETGAGMMERDDFVVVRDEWEFTFTASGKGKIFAVATPAEVPYQTYAEKHL
jgi:redox-sensitive bicupin YhaK (pirin superfamily)